MTWTNISDQSPNWSPDTDETPAWSKGTQVIPDPDFNYSNQWDLTDINAGTGIVSGGKFTGTGWSGTVFPEGRSQATVGKYYIYEFTVESFQFNISEALLPIALVYYGGKTLWNGLSANGSVPTGTGTFTGEIQATASAGFQFSSLLLFGTGNSDIVISYASVYEKRIPSTTWSDDTASSSWTPLTDKTTVWS